MKELKEENGYTADTRPYGINPEGFQSYVPKLGQTAAYKAVAGALEQVVGAATTSLKITLSEVGVQRAVADTAQKLANGAKASAANAAAESPMANARYETLPPSHNRYDKTNAFSFKCGDVYLPISMTYNVRASKRTSSSQLVDGVEIVQMINREPKIISVNLRIEKDKTRLDAVDMARNMAFGNPIGSTTAARSPETDVMELGAVLDSLYENSDVFHIDNDVINKDLHVEWAYMESFEYRTTAGTSVVEISMTLHEINMTENAIIFGQATVNSTSSAGGGGQVSQ